MLSDRSKKKPQVLSAPNDAGVWLLADFLCGYSLEEARLLNGFACSEDVEATLRSTILQGGYRPEAAR